LGYDLDLAITTTKLGNNWVVNWVDRTNKTIIAATAVALNTEESLENLALREILLLLWTVFYLDNGKYDVCCNKGLWNSLWKMCGSKLKLTLVTILNLTLQSVLIMRQGQESHSSYCTTVATAARNASITFGLNTQVSSATKLS